MNADNLGTIAEFKCLPLHVQTIVANAIVDTNRLEISTEAFRKKASENFLIVRMGNTSDCFVSIGLKVVGPKLQDAILDYFKLPEGPKLTAIESEKFYGRFMRNEMHERGWATNRSGVRGALATLDGAFDDYLKKIDKDRSFTFCTVVSNNEAGNASALKFGYRCVGQFNSPFSESRLNLYLWTD